MAHPTIWAETVRSNWGEGKLGRVACTQLHMLVYCQLRNKGHNINLFTSHDSVWASADVGRRGALSDQEMQHTSLAGKKRDNGVYTAETERVIIAWGNYNTWSSAVGVALIERLIVMSVKRHMFANARRIWQGSQGYSEYQIHLSPQFRLWDRRPELEDIVSAGHYGGVCLPWPTRKASITSEKCIGKNEKKGGNGLPMEQRKL